MIVLCWIGVIPVARAHFHLHAAQKDISSAFSGSLAEHPASRGFDAASASDPFDPTPEIARARWLQTRVPRAAVEALTTAMGRDPFQVGLPQMRSKLYLDLAQSTGDDGDYFAAVDDARRTLELYPLNPSGMVSLADLQAMAGEALKSDMLLREALANYDRAIRLDDRRLSWEKLHRMREVEREEIAAKIQRLRKRIKEPVP